MNDAIFALLVYLAAVPANLFVLVYFLRRQWFRSPFGWALMSQALGIAILLDFSALYQAFGPDYFGRDAVRIGGMIYVLGGELGVFAVLLKSRRDTARERHALAPTTQE